jgi:hypothetical protein
MPDLKYLYIALHILINYSSKQVTYICFIKNKVYYQGSYILSI